MGAKPSFINIVLSLWGWAFAVFFTCFFYLCGLLIAWPLSFFLDRKKTRYLLHDVAVIWGKAIVGVNAYWRIQVEGRENIDPSKSYVVVANHQSMLDILVALAGLPLHFKFMAKEELFNIPFIGWHMTGAGYIPILRGNIQSGKSALDTAEQWLAKGVSVLFFPEGTRSLDGEIKHFKHGAFKAAQEANVEILPIIIEGTGQALPKKSYVLNERTEMLVQIGEPVAVPREGDLIKIIEGIRQDMMGRLAVIRRHRETKT